LEKLIQLIEKEKKMNLAAGSRPRIALLVLPATESLKREKYVITGESRDSLLFDSCALCGHLALVFQTTNFKKFKKKIKFSFFLLFHFVKCQVFYNLPINVHF